MPLFILELKILSITEWNFGTIISLRNNITNASISLHLNRCFQSCMDCYSAPLPHDKLVAKLQSISLSVIREPKFVCFDVFIEACSLWCDWWEVIIGLDNSLTPNRQQAIIWTNDDPVRPSVNKSWVNSRLQKHHQVSCVPSLMLLSNVNVFVVNSMSVITYWIQTYRIVLSCSFYSQLCIWHISLVIYRTFGSSWLYTL